MIWPNTALLPCKHNKHVTKAEQYHKPFLKSQRPISSAQKCSWQRTVELETTMHLVHAAAWWEYTSDSFAERPLETRRNDNLYESRSHHRRYYCNQKPHNTFLSFSQGLEKFLRHLNFHSLHYRVENLIARLRNQPKPLCDAPIESPAASLLCLRGY